MRRSFKFRLPEGIVEARLKTCDSGTMVETKVFLIGVRDAYKKAYQFDAKVLKGAILHHFMSFFVTQFVPRIEISLSGGDPAVIDKETLSTIDNEPFELKGRSFRIIHMKLTDPSVSSHSVHFCAADRVVTSRNLDDLLGNFTRRRIQADGEHAGPPR